LIVIQVAYKPPSPVTPAKAGVHLSTAVLVLAWTPTFAGVTMRVSAAADALSPLLRLIKCLASKEIPNAGPHWMLRGLKRRSLPIEFPVPAG